MDVNGNRTTPAATEHITGLTETEVAAMGADQQPVTCTMGRGGKGKEATSPRRQST